MQIRRTSLSFCMFFSRASRVLSGEHENNTVFPARWPRVSEDDTTKDVSSLASEYTTVLDSGLHAVDSRFQVLDSSLCQCNLDSGFQFLVGYRFLELYFGIQSLGFRIPQERFSCIPDFIRRHFLDYRTRIPLHVA